MTPYGDPWKTHGRPLDPMDDSWETRRSPVSSYESPMTLLWGSHGSPLDLSWGSHGASMGARGSLVGSRGSPVFLFSGSMGLHGSPWDSHPILHYIISGTAQ